MQGITKEFPGVMALDDVDFRVREGEIHGLVGENGAGKSTLIKIIAGIYQRDQGSITINGQPCGALNPKEVENLGIQFIHQERQLVPEFSVSQSVFLGQELTISPFFPLADSKRMKIKAEDFIQQNLGVNLDGDTLIRDLTVAQKQIVQIAKALMQNPCIIAFDEPTAPLAKREVEKLFEIIKNLKSQGITIIYISHYLQEVTELCDRVTVLRNGVKIATKPISETSHDDIVHMMVGRELDDLFPSRKVEIGEKILEVKNIFRKDEFEDISFDIRKGEVVGITGLLGSGRHGVAEALFGMRPLSEGEVQIKETRLTRWSAVRAVSEGIGLVPRDRREQGLVLNMSMNDNINLASLEKVSRFGFMKHAAAKQRTDDLIDSLEIRPPRRGLIVRYLSGGNQQKVVLGKWLTSDVSVYILDEPTVGVDVGAKAEIYLLINQLVSEGAGVILISSDLPELIGTTDRILVMFRGTIIKELKTSETNPENLLYWATGGNGSEA